MPVQCQGKIEIHNMQFDSYPDIKGLGNKHVDYTQPLYILAFQRVQSIAGSFPWYYIAWELCGEI